MISNMASSLIVHKRIKTTLAKAKALRQYVEPLLTKAKNDNMHSRRVVFSYLQDKESVKELFDEVAGKIAQRNGGYTRIIKLGNRLGDNAEMCLMELVDYNETYQSESSAKKPKTRRSRRGGGGGKKKDTQATADNSPKTNTDVEDKAPEAKSEETEDKNKGEDKE